MKTRTGRAAPDGQAAAVSRVVVMVAATLAALVAWSSPAAALLGDLSAAQVQEAVEAGTNAMIQEDFGQEWDVRLPGGEEIVVSTPFSRLALAARQAALKGEPLTDKQRQDQIDRGKGRIQLLVAIVGPKVDFARWYQPVLRVGDREVKATFAQNERTALRLEDRRYEARNIYVFPLEGLPLRGTVTLVVRQVPEQKEILKASIDLSKMR